MRFSMALITVFLHTAVLSFSSSSAQHDPGASASPVGNQGISLTYWGCSENQRKEIEEAMIYASNIVQYVTKIRESPPELYGHLTPGATNAIESKYFGRNLSGEKKEYITNVFHTLHPKTSPIWSNLTCICLPSCAAPDNPGGFGVAYTYAEEHSREIFICPLFLDPIASRKVSELSGCTARSIEDWYSTGTVMLHEILHLAHLLPQYDRMRPIRPIIDEPVYSLGAWGELAYGERLSKKLATHSRERALTNADSFALYALEVFVTGSVGWKKDAPSVADGEGGGRGDGTEERYHGEL